MARPTLATHPKFARLSMLVGGRAIARGSLELIWDAAYASGEPDVGDAGAVEAVADWRGKPGELASALALAGFLERDGEVFRVHDLEDHAPDYVLKRWEREAKRRAAGESIRSIRRQAAARRWSQPPSVMQTADTDRTEANTDRQLTKHAHANVSPPAPAPITDQIQIPPNPPGGGRGSGPGSKESNYPAEFETFWATTAKGGSKHKAHKTWVRLGKPDANRLSIAWGRWKLTRQWREGYIPHVVTWLNGREFEQEPPNDTRPTGPEKSVAYAPDLRCQFHRLPKSQNKKARSPSKVCPECRHVEVLARNKKVEEEPKSIGELMREQGWKVE